MKTLYILMSLLVAIPAFPCSRFVSIGKNQKQDVIVGRSMDWLEDPGSNMWLFPRGIARDGLAGDNSLKWTSKYGSVVLTSYDVGTADGLNEKGLVANILYLTESDFGTRNQKMPGLAVSLWAQYYLDNFQTVAEAIASMEKTPFQVLTGAIETVGGRKEGTVHLAISDRTGDTAVIEYIKGEVKIYHDKDYRVMTNSPPFDQQLAGLKQYKGFGGSKDLPGTTDAADRFVRAAFYSEHLPEPQDYREAVAGVLSVIRNVSQPFGTSDPARPNISPTRWRVVADLTKGIYFYESSVAPNLVWVQLPKLDFRKNASVKKITLVKNYDLVGDITNKFKKTKSFQFQKPGVTVNLKAGL
ncbi:linear amide C-N hydrolase [Bdellovibrio svalbardensis]|uniref:Linear amide C-N hydrolase n=1 Tax=Bdellovibrio svalbardensis TaxID=2972972 RepID=A0ABT6DJ93_9BACT|nr:linear amide C-N hydrolase [Bdellovibrio svalbardensis]MDG0816868.1 linear amide C-N hydrolase [Bdellovibrio svalbardensis]